MNIDTDLKPVWLFMRELEIQSRLALRAYIDLIRLCLKATTEDVPFFSDDYFRVQDEFEGQRLLLAHAFLSHVANISKILWPPCSRKSPIKQEVRDQRGEALRRILGITDSSVLHGRSLRDDLEHFDERLESWSLTPAGMNLDLIDMNSVAFGWSRPDSPNLAGTSLRSIRWPPLVFRFLDRETNLDLLADKLVPLRHGVISWQHEAAPAGFRKTKIPVDALPPLDSHLTIPYEITSNADHVATTWVILQTLGVKRDGECQGVLGALVEERGGAWVLIQHDTDPVAWTATVHAPTEYFTVTAHAASADLALAFAVATLIREQTQNIERPSILRVTESGVWSLH
ncbi:MAG: hypothetical protein H0V37_02625 [Chloroflexia bacterium]|nr:hypothetical protein [Chloroflexia bacterium]